MNIPGLFVEYLIIGALALIWLYPVLKNEGLATIHPSYLPLLALGLYAVGMIIEFFAWCLTLPVKKSIRTYAENREGTKAGKRAIPGGQKVEDITVERTNRCQIKFALYAPEIAKESAMRSSRDRIARGAIVNSIFLTIFVLQWPYGVGLILISIIMWVFFEVSSYIYDLRAEQIIDDKIKWDRSDHPRA